MRCLLATGLMAIMAIVGVAQEKIADQDANTVAKEVLAKAQGNWKWTGKWDDSEIVTVKEIKGNKETLTRFRGDEKIMQWTVDFEITRVGDLNVFTYRNMTHTYGPYKGQVNKNPSSYFFKIHNDKWHQIHGFEESVQDPPAMTIYTKVIRSRSTRASPFNLGSDRYARYAKGLMTQYDQNKDGKLDQNELGKMRRPPKGADANNDGVVTLDELIDDLSGKTSSQRREPSTRSSSKSKTDSADRFARYAKGLMNEYDKDRDGNLSPDELKAMRRPPKGADANNDGVVTVDELSDVLSGKTSNQRREPSPRSSLELKTDNADRYARYAKGLMTQYDQNKDGKLDQSELGEMRRPPKGADANNDGVVTLDELSDVLSGKTSNQRREPSTRSSLELKTDNADRYARYAKGLMTQYDQNKDGKLDQSELGNMRRPPKGADANNDGVVTLDELSDILRQRSSKSKPIPAGDSDSQPFFSQSMKRNFSTGVTGGMVVLRRMVLGF